MSKEAEAYKRAYDHGWQDALWNLEIFVKQSNTLDAWAKDAVQRVVEQFMKRGE